MVIAGLGRNFSITTTSLPHRVRHSRLPGGPCRLQWMPWYMSEGPGRYYHPGMFPIIGSVLNRRDLAPGTYDLWKLAPLNERDPSVKAGIMHYSADLGS